MLKFKLPSSCRIQIIYIHNKKVLNIIKSGNSIYEYIPSSIKISKVGDTVEFSTHSTSESVTSFFKKTQTFIRYIDRGTKKHLFLKGLGLKVGGIRGSRFNTLNFKLGYSHEVPLVYSSLDQNILLRRTHIFIEGSNPVGVGNLAKRIAMLRKPDAYKGRGVWLHGRRYKLKVVKKKK